MIDGRRWMVEGEAFGLLPSAFGFPSPTLQRENPKSLKTEAKMQRRKSPFKIPSSFPTLGTILLFLAVLFTFPTNTYGKELVINLKVENNPIVVKIISDAPEKIKDAVLEAVKGAVNMPKYYIQNKLTERGIYAGVIIKGNTYIINEYMYPKLELLQAYSGGAIASEENSLAKKVKLTQSSSRSFGVK